MSKKHKILIVLALGVVAGFTLILIQHSHNFAVMNPQGVIAQKQKNLILLTLGMSLFIVLPVFVMTFVIAWKYRASNTKTKYRPDWDHNATLETIWWAIPIIMISFLAGITWQTSHDLDPFKPINSSVAPMTIQVVALDWKWLFIYPDQSIATVNYVRFPVDTPINFEITSDAPMNSFWIPQLGGQIYAMSGMSTHLHLMSDNIGVYRGVSANISGRGFAGMHFKAEATTDLNFSNWVSDVQQSSPSLSQAGYDKLSKPSQNVPAKTYSNVDSSLYDTIVMKYMMPASEHRRMNGMVMQ